MDKMPEEKRIIDPEAGADAGSKDRDIFDELLDGGKKEKDIGEKESEELDEAEEAQEEENLDEEAEKVEEDVKETDIRDEETVEEKTGSEAGEKGNAGGREEAESWAGGKGKSEGKVKLKAKAGDKMKGEGREIAKPDKLNLEEIKNTILSKAEDAVKKSGTLSTAPLSFLKDEEKGNVFIGRKKSFLAKYGYEGALHFGKVNEYEHSNANVFLDSLNPHVIFVCGARGSGKSYDLGVMAEELALKNHNVGVIVIDPIGVFWSMRFPNREEKEIAELTRWNLLPQGLENLCVFIPEGMKSEVPKSTYDATFSMFPAILTADDWCLTFGIDRFSPTGLLLGIVLKKAKQGYKNMQGKQVKGKENEYSLDDLAVCLQSDAELHSAEKGYKPDSIRALVSRFEAAKSWGIFSEKGTPLAELSREGRLTVIDTSFLEDNVSALVIGVLARRILSARKLSTRNEAAKRLRTADLKEMLELEIPPTWLFIDEAHTLIPSGNLKTPATDALVEYVKQGRRPGCSLVFATQQPSAIDSKVLSQLDLVVAHKLVFDDDIKAVYKRMPGVVPGHYKKTSFIKTIPIGVGLVSDRSEETSRAFMMRIRPRMSQHEGREAETTERAMHFTPEHAKKLAVEMVLRNLEREGRIEIETIGQAVQNLDAKYRAKLRISEVLDELEKKGVKVEADFVSMPGYRLKQQDEIIEMPKEASEGAGEEGIVSNIELLTLPLRIDEAGARLRLDKVRKRKTLGLFGEEELVAGMNLMYETIWKVDLDEYKSKTEFIRRNCYISSMTGEFVHFRKNEFIESQGLSELSGMDEDEIKVLMSFGKEKKTLDDAQKQFRFTEGKARSVLERLVEKGYAGKIKEERKNLYWLKKELDLPDSPEYVLVESLNKAPYVQAEVVGREKERFDRSYVSRVLKSLWGNVKIKGITEVYRPVWAARLSNARKGSERAVKIDAMTGRIL